jgi:tetratricopeptide (TPR) repeat protein
MSKEGAEEIEQAIRHWDQMVAIAPDDPEPFQMRAAAYVNLAAGAFRQLGHYRQEESAYRKAIEDYAALGKSMPDAPVYIEYLALAENDLGSLLNLIGRPREATEALTKACDEFERLANSYPSVIRFREQFASSLDNLGRSQLELGHLTKAVTLFEKAALHMEGLTSQFPHEPGYQIRQAVTRAHLGDAQAQIGKTEAGIESLTLAIHQLEKLCSPNERPDQNYAAPIDVLAAVHGEIGDIYYANGELDKARTAFATSQKIWKEAFEQSRTAEIAHRAASFLATCPVDAAPDKSFGLEFAKLAADAAPDNGHYLGTHAMSEFRMNHPEEAIQRLDQASKMDSYDRGRDGLIRALCQKELGRSEEAEKTLANAAAWIAENRPGNEPLKQLLAEAKRTIASRQGAANSAPSTAK